MEVGKQKTWKPTVAGIIDIVVGASGLILVIFLIIGVMITGGVFDIPGIEAIPSFVPGLIFAVAVIVAAVNVLILIGGIHAVQRRNWGLALAGSIAAFVVSNILGVIAIIFTALSKDEFEHSSLTHTVFANQSNSVALTQTEKDFPENRL